MARADEYRRYAAECVRVAQTTSTPTDKQLMLEMAQKWRELAEKVERKEQPQRTEGGDTTAEPVAWVASSDGRPTFPAAPNAAQPPLFNGACLAGGRERGW